MGNRVCRMSAPDIYGDSSDDDALLEGTSVEVPTEETKFEGLRDENVASKAAEEAEAAGDAVNIIFVFEDESLAQQEFRVGQEVGHLKMAIAAAKDVDYGRVSLFLDDQMMFDPLSLTDFESIRGASEATIHVKIAD